MGKPPRQSVVVVCPDAHSAIPSTFNVTPVGRLRRATIPSRAPRGSQLPTLSVLSRQRDKSCRVKPDARATPWPISSRKPRCSSLSTARGTMAAPP